MPLIKQRQVQTNDKWQFWLPEEATAANALEVDSALNLPEQNWVEALVVPAEFLEQVDLKRVGHLGASLNTDQDYEILLPWLEQLQLIALDFLAFRDGRGFSQARLLRRAGFKGELRALGDIGRDRLAYLEKCGFDSFYIPDERFKAADLTAFTEIKVAYQSATNHLKPATSKVGSHVA